VSLVAAASCAALFLLPASSASQPAPASLAGVVTAPDGARLPGANLDLLDSESTIVARAISTEAGLFRIRSLAPGRYVLQVALHGFESLRTPPIDLAAGQTASITVRLSVAIIQETVRVVGETPRDTIESFDVRASFARDVGEALTALSGVAKLRKGAIANDVVLRGFQGKDVTVLIDGQRVDGACPGHMDPPAFHVDFAEVGRIEVSRGPFDVANQGGLAGIVNVVTQRPQRGWHGTANLTLGSFHNLSASATTSFGRRGWTVLGGASARGADPYEDGAGRSLLARANYRSDAVGDLPAYDIWTAWGRAVVARSRDTQFHLSYTRQSADTMVYPYLQMDALFDTADRAGATLEIAELPGGWSAFSARLYLTRVDHWMTDEYRTTAFGVARAYSMGTRAKTQIVGARTSIRRGPLSLGFEASRREWDSRTQLAARQYVAQAPLPEATIDAVGGFAAVSRDLGPAWRLDAGLRIDRAVSDVDRTIANTAVYRAYFGTDRTRATDLLPVGYARAIWRHRAWTLSAGVGHAARVPDQLERYYALQRMGSDWVGNPGLRPSRNTGFDGEARFTGRGVDAALAAFSYIVNDHLTVSDRSRIADVPGVMNRIARSYSNVDAIVRGVEVRATLPVSRVVSLTAEGSAVRGTTRGHWPAGPNLPEMPPARARVRLRFDDGRLHAAAELVGAARQADVVAALGESPTPAFTIANLRAGLRLRSLEVTAAIDNLFDSLHAEHLSYQRDPFRTGVRVYEPGRMLTLNVGARF
jgi:iron complex outermembrane receptor protein